MDNPFPPPNGAAPAAPVPPTGATPPAPPPAPPQPVPAAAPPALGPAAPAILGPAHGTVGVPPAVAPGPVAGPGPAAPTGAGVPPTPRRGPSRTVVALAVGLVCLAVGGGAGFAAGVATDAGVAVVAWLDEPAYSDAWTDDGWTDEWSDGGWEGSGTRQDPWLFDGYTVSGDEWEVLLEEPYEATAEILAHDDVNVPPPDGTEYWIVPVTAIYYGPSSQVSAWGAVDVGFVGDDGVHVDGQCGAVPHALVGTGLIGSDDTVTGNVCVAVPAGAPGLWTLSLEGYQPWHFKATDPLAG